ncbi:transposable element Tcb2 transposase [Trichonephila clavipes]|nr:transposable element Tcb2 transposase [Trichonephila clavipes]
MATGAVQAGRGSLRVWGVYSWRDMGLLICLDTTMIGDRYEHSSEYRHFRWPPKSPYMKTIEYIWDALQGVVQKRSPPSLTPTDLWTALQDSWCHLPPALLQTLIKSLPGRIETLMRARGRPT